MKDTTVVTGPLRCGTSCVTGLLERCGLDMGRAIRVLRNATVANPRGHFEHDLLFTINERLLLEAEGGDFGFLALPPLSALEALAPRRERYFRLFLDRFDGELCKDPQFCATLPLWERRWSSLRRVVFCLRNPISAARSMQQRYGSSLQQGLEVWTSYCEHFLEFSLKTRLPVFVLDYDAFLADPQARWRRLLRWLDRGMGEDRLSEALAGFVDSAHNHWSHDRQDVDRLGGRASQAYQRLHEVAVVSTSTRALA